jgi:integral membrane sensor domain MASE1
MSRSVPEWWFVARLIGVGIGLVLAVYFVIREGRQHRMDAQRWRVASLVTVGLALVGVAFLLATDETFPIALLGFALILVGSWLERRRGVV